MTTKSPKTNPQIISKLQSQNPEWVVEAIEKLRNSGNSSYIPVLIELLHSSKSPEIDSKIMNLLADIKDKEVVPQLMDAIQNKKYATERKKLVSLCWENGLDFSANLPVFVDLLITEELDIAFEAYTVITNMEGKITAEMLNAETDKMEIALNTVGDQKKPLLIDIIDFLPKLSDL